ECEAHDRGNGVRSVCVAVPVAAGGSCASERCRWRSGSRRGAISGVSARVRESRRTVRNEIDPRRDERSAVQSEACGGFAGADVSPVPRVVAEVQAAGGGRVAPFLPPRGGRCPAKRGG